MTASVLRSSRDYSVEESSRVSHGCHVTLNVSCDYHMDILGLKIWVKAKEMERGEREGKEKGS